MPKEHFVFIKEGGQEVTYIHSDEISKLFEGKREAPKVSHIRFDEENQEWFAILRDGREIARDKLRNTVVVNEAAVINKMFAEGDYIPGGYHASPMFDLKKEGLSMPKTMEYVGHFRHIYDIYISDSGHCDVAVRRCSAGFAVAIVSSGSCNGAYSISSLSGHPDQVTTPQNTDDAEALIEAERRFKLEQKIKEEEEKRKCPK